MSSGGDKTGRADRVIVSVVVVNDNRFALGNRQGKDDVAVKITNITHFISFCWSWNILSQRSEHDSKDYNRQCWNHHRRGGGSWAAITR